MNRQNIIRIFLAIIVCLWLAAARMPYHLAIVQDGQRTSYDIYVTSQEFLIRKQIEKLRKIKSVSTNTNLDWEEALANIFWGSHRLDEALSLYKQIRAQREKIDKAYDQRLVSTILSLAGVYRDTNNLEEARSCYERVWQLDQMKLPVNDPRLARDQSSLALIAYMRGDQEQDPQKRQEYFKNCLKHLDNAQIILQNQTHPRTAAMANLLYLRFLTCRDLGEKEASKLYKKEADYLTQKLKRPYVAPWS